MGGGVELPERELRWRFSRASGPGGQGVNTTDSRVELSFDLGGSPSVPAPLRERALGRLSARLVDGVLTIVASEHRSQLRNREAARDRLAAVLRAAIAPGSADPAPDEAVGQGSASPGRREDPPGRGQAAARAARRVTGAPRVG